MSPDRRVRFRFPPLALVSPSVYLWFSHHRIGPGRLTPALCFFKVRQMLAVSQRPVVLPTGPPALLSRWHSSHRGLPPVPCRTFSGFMLLPAWQLGLLWVNV